MSKSIISAVSKTKYIADAPAIYTNKGVKSTIGNTGKSAVCLADNKKKDYVPGGMPSDVYNKIKENEKAKKASINKMASNLAKDKTLEVTAEQKTTMLVVGEKMLNKGYEAKFVAGVLANIVSEGGVAGKFESSNYSSNPGKKPEYLKNMDKDFDYTKKYSGKNIREVGIRETVKLQEKVSEIKHKDEKGKVIPDQFGLGICQFTGKRTGDVLGAYQEFYNKTGENHPTKEQCLEIESDFMLKELKGKDFNYIYSEWEKGEKTAYDAGKLFCKEYEKPADGDIQTAERGNDAEKIYKVMKKK